METLGFMSIDGLSTGGTKNHAPVRQKAKLSFARRYIDNNLFSMHHHSGKDDKSFPTEHGLNVSQAIGEARKSLDLTHKYGCAPHDFWVSRRPYPHHESIFTLIEKKMLPETMSKFDRLQFGGKALVVTNTGAIRFDIFKGAFTKDTKFLVSPFTSGFRYIPDVPYEAARQVIKLLNNEGPIVLDMMNQKTFLYPPEVHAARYRPHMLSSPEIAYASQAPWQQVLKGDEPETFPGYTTKDDAGTDGDDTIHSQIEFYSVPNCIQSTIGIETEDDHLPETVDLAYNEFIQKWILLALEYTGQKYTSDDTKSWGGGKSFTDIMTDWVEEQWGTKEEKCPT
jgi:hypothetical protein